MLALSVGFLAYGVIELRTSRRLASAGRVAPAQVVNKSVESRPKQRKAYYLEVQYRTAEGQALTQRSRVSAERFARSNRGDSIPVRYLPSEPDVFALGATASPNYFHLLMGLLFLGIASIYHFYGSSSRGGRVSSPR